MKWRAYPKYKESGVEWLGDVPAGWDAKPLGSVARVKARLGWRGLKADEYVDDGYPMLATPNIKDFGIDFENVVYVSEQRYLESPEIMLQDGDVLLAKDGSTLGTVNVVRCLPRPSTLNGSIALIRPSASLDPVYTYYWFRGDYVSNLIQSLKGGMGAPHLFQSDLRKFRLLIPPSEEQSVIALSLDRETARIDTLIAKQERLIELLQEKRQALISHAVTKGLNPDAPMKPSGVEWLGAVPAHWTVLAVKRVLEYVTSGARDWGGRYSDDGSLFLRIGNLTRDGVDLDLSDLQFVSAPEGADTRRTRVRAGDIVVSITADLGSVAWIPKQVEGGYVSQHLALCRPKGVINSRWLAYALRSDAGRTQLLLSGYGGTKTQLSLGDVREPVVALPPVLEQERIAEYLDLRLVKMGRLVEKANESIALMREHRTALISAAVTGKIDVREAHQRAYA